MEAFSDSVPVPGGALSLETAKKPTNSFFYYSLQGALRFWGWPGEQVGVFGGLIGTPVLWDPAVLLPFPCPAYCRVTRFPVAENS